MAIPGPGVAISMNTIATEFGGTVPHSLSEYYRGGGLVPNTPTNAAIPTSGQIAMGNFYGSANRSQIALTISGNTYNYDVYANRGPTYVAGASDITVTVNPGVTVGSTATPTYAMLVPSAFNPADTVTIINQGTIQGMGGAGGSAATVSTVPSGAGAFPGNPGAGGGSALYVNRPTTVTNNGTIAGGGGGGGSGVGIYGPASPKVSNQGSGGGGGGGGAGFNGGGGGAGGAVNPIPGQRSAGSPGGGGSSPAGGGGGSFGPLSPGQTRGGSGGAGGGRGAGGASGGTALYQGGGGLPGTAGSGAGAGNYIVGNPFVTWPATGTRQGGVA